MQGRGKERKTGPRRTNPNVKLLGELPGVELLSSLQLSVRNGERVVGVCARVAAAHRSGVFGTAWQESLNTTPRKPVISVWHLKQSPLRGGSLLVALTSIVRQCSQRTCAQRSSTTNAADSGAVSRPSPQLTQVVGASATVVMCGRTLSAVSGSASSLRRSRSSSSSCAAGASWAGIQYFRSLVAFFGELYGLRCGKMSGRVEPRKSASSSLSLSSESESGPEGTRAGTESTLASSRCIRELKNDSSCAGCVRRYVGLGADWEQERSASVFRALLSRPVDVHDLLPSAFGLPELVVVRWRGDGDAMARVTRGLVVSERVGRGE